MINRKISIALVVPHNPVWIGSSKSIIYHPAFYRKLSIFAPFFNYIIVFRGSLGNSVIRKLKLTHNGKDCTIIDIPIIYHGILLYTLLFIVHFTCLIFRLKSLKNVKLYLLCFNHAHLYSMYAKILSAVLKLRIISFYVTTPINFKERILYLVSKIMDTLSITNHILIASRLKLKNPLIIPNVPDRCFFIDVPLKSRNKRNILLVARLTHEKRVNTAITVIAILKHILPDIKLLIVGDGPLKKALEYIAQKYGLLNKNVFFLGYRTVDEILDLMKKAGVLIHTSIDEYFPNVIVEASACGVPVVTFDTEAYRWVLGNGLIKSRDEKDFAKAIIMLIKDDNLWFRQVNIQRKQLKYLTRIYNNQVEKLLKILHVIQ